ncbi:hypothetical protein JCM5296_002578 [Sporobolomyces johnsonii]
MSSFDHSRGFSIPSSFTRQDSWNASDGWAAPTIAHPPAASSSSAPLYSNGHPSSIDTPHKLDYSLIDEDQPENANAFGDNLLGRAGLGYRDGEEWQLPRQQPVEVHLKPELSGFFVLPHHVFLVVTEKGSSVERRYSDFVWLLDCLTRRYPFRMLPALPPKRMQLQGHYLASDDGFLDRRRRGLERALTFLINHPVLKLDGLLATFLHEQSDLALWRKRTPITLAEESVTRTLTPTELSSLPLDVDAKLSSLRSRLPSLIEIWSKLAVTTDRIAHRRLNQAAEWKKMREQMNAAVAVEKSGWRVSEVEAVERDEAEVGKSAGAVGETEESSARRLLSGWAEDTKRHRELYINFRDLFAREQTLGVDNLDQLRKRIESNLAKLELLRQLSPPPATFAADFEKLTTAIDADQRAVDALGRRRAFVRWCVWEEALFLFRSTSLLRTTLKDLAEEETTFARRLGEQWEVLAEALGAVL